MKKVLYIKFFVVTLLITCFLNSGFSQEKLTVLSENISLRNAARNQTPKRSPEVYRMNPLPLPFKDDFSNKSVYPDPTKWMDRDVFINNNFPVNAPTYGVATFDALNDTGAIYPYATPTNFIADHLTSAFIDLSSNTTADSIYLSFYYQPQGLGNDPEINDSLVLEFLDSTAVESWLHIWSVSGNNADSFFVASGGKWFKRVMIPIKDPRYYRSDFQFRFLNYASIASNNIPSWRSNSDQWNLDYVYLNSGRNKSDTAVKDVAFVNSGSSLLKNYSSMPLWQYLVDPAGETRDTLETNKITNLSTTTIPCKYDLFIYNPDNLLIKQVSGGSFNLPPFTPPAGYQTFQPHAKPAITGFTFTAGSADTAVFKVIQALDGFGTPQEFITLNDTITYLQEFSNYYAYDDGSAEAGYGLSPAGAQLAYRFRVNKTDTICGAMMYFNRVMGEANKKNFYLAIWADDHGKPGRLIYRNTNYLKPVFTSGANEFTPYAFDKESPIVIDVQDPVFYLGWIQTTDDNLNLGFDRNTDHAENIFYNATGTWTNSAFSGSLMMRPVMGKNIFNVHKNSPAPKPEVTITPNPNKGSFSFKLDNAPELNTNNWVVKVFTTSGQLVYQAPFNETCDLSGLHDGIYMLNLCYPSGVLVTKAAKLVIIK